MRDRAGFWRSYAFYGMPLGSLGQTVKRLALLGRDIPNGPGRVVPEDDRCAMLPGRADDLDGGLAEGGVGEFSQCQVRVGHGINFPTELV